MLHTRANASLETEEFSAALVHRELAANDD